MQRTDKIDYAKLLGFESVAVIGPLWVVRWQC